MNLKITTVILQLDEMTNSEKLAVEEKATIAEVKSQLEALRHELHSHIEDEAKKALIFTAVEKLIWWLLLKLTTAAHDLNLLF